MNTNAESLEILDRLKSQNNCNSDTCVPAIVNEYFFETRYLQPDTLHSLLEISIDITKKYHQPYQL
ncbi:MAG: hypothetical protein C0594_08635 [Marinilabiliales bacterium]|nr:MAG: hypothetical protein C0594_08635 [Marinilabiliales bacterium]